MKNTILTAQKISPTSSSTLSPVKKEWYRPQIKQLNVQDTKSGEHDWFPEDSFLGYFFGGSS